MKPVATRLLSVVAFSASLAVAGIAQDKPATAVTNDPRVGLKAGFRDAGVAARGIELVATMPRAEGFYDPKAPAGSITKPSAGGGAAATPDAGPPAGATPAA
ncbi:MAG: hypothetical protein ABIQ52_04380, partial [Vicinamibacterales bacterium]